MNSKQFSIQKFLPALLGITLLTGMVNSCSVNPQKNGKRPNILFIMTDDHAFQAMSCYNGKLNQTPNLDRIANEGVIFTNSFVTNSICAPSRAVLLTGKHSHMNGQINNSVTFDGSQQTLPKLLQQAGYRTALIGKWHLKSDPTGFDFWKVLIGQGPYYNPVFNEMGERKQVEGYTTNLITDISIEWLEKHDKSIPFCLLVHHKAPHRTWMPDSIHFDLYDDTTFPIPDNFYDEYENRQAAAEQKMHIFRDMDLVYDLKMLDKEGEIQTKYRRGFERTHNSLTPEQRVAWDREYVPLIEEFKKANLEGKELAEWKYQRYMTDYLRCIASVDENMGRLLDYLDKTSLTENTLVVYTSDQGFYLGEHGWFDKRFMYEESLRTPLVMRLPKGFQRQGEIPEMVQNIDYAPTFLDFAGIEIPVDIQGESLKPLLNRKKPLKNWRNSIYYHYYEFPNEHMAKRHYGIRTGQHKLIHFYNDIDKWELYDLQEDPGEMNNLYGQPEYNEVIIELKKQLEVLQEKYQDTDRSTY